MAVNRQETFDPVPTEVVKKIAYSAETDALPYLICVHVQHGSFQYRVDSADRAVGHAEAIMSNGTYRTQIEGGIKVHKVYSVSVYGPDLESKYQDTFVRS